MKILFIAVLVVSVRIAAAQSARLSYPQPPRTNQVDDYHGVKIEDPYRSLENADAPATQKFVEEENRLTQSVLAQAPGREKIRQQLTSIFNYERFGNTFKSGSRYFYFHNSGLQNQSVLYVSDSLNGQARVLLDPNTLRADGTAALDGISPSTSGKYLAYAIAEAGSDWKEWRVREVATGKDLPDLIRWNKEGAPAWLPDDSGFAGKTAQREAYLNYFLLRIRSSDVFVQEAIRARSSHL